MRSITLRKIVIFCFICAFTINFSVYSRTEDGESQMDKMIDSLTYVAFSDYNVYPELAYAYIDKGMINDAIMALEAYVKKDKYNSLHKYDINQASNKPYYTLLKLYVRTDKWQKAIKIAGKFTHRVKGLTEDDVLNYNRNKDFQLNSFRNELARLGYDEDVYKYDIIATEHGDYTNTNSLINYMFRHQNRVDIDKMFKYANMRSLRYNFDVDPSLEILGWCQLNGVGCDVDSVAGIRNLEKVERPNYQYTSYMIAVAYYEGKIVPRNYPLARDKFIKTVNKNDFNKERLASKALEYLSKMYRFGRGVKRDEKRADELLEWASREDEEIARKLKDIGL